MLQSFENVGNILLAALGISFLIFIHELGHFLAARLFKVRVETFSLGFGPRLFGARRGDTDYRVSLVPLGGYVKMAGEYGDHDPDAPLAVDDLMAKPAWQRAIIFSAGVIVNFAFAFVAFPLAFSLGVPFTAPVVGSVVAGGPAWRAGLQPGDEVVAVAGNRVYSFQDIALEIALADPEHTRLLVRRDGEELLVPVRPARNESEGRWELGINPAFGAEVVVAPDKPAARAGLETGDRILALDGVELPQAPVLAGNLLLAGPFGAGAGQPVELAWDHQGERRQGRIVPDPAAEPPPAKLGVQPRGTRVAGLRGIADEQPFAWRMDDVVLSVAGTPVHDREELLAVLSAAAPGDLASVVRRDRGSIEVMLPAAQRAAAVAGDVAFDSDMEGTSVRVLPDGALAAAGMRDGDQILTLDGQTVESYADLPRAVRADPRTYRLQYRRVADNSVQTIEVLTQRMVVPDYGFSPKPVETLHAEGFGGAVRAGIDTSLNIIRTTWLTLTKLFTGDVGASNLGGIVSISVITYQFAEFGFPKLLFFLGLLSINLGFINVLPIPVLDGGQMLFLLLEKIKGRRLSERFMNGMQMAGLIAIVALVLYVTYNDIAKLVG
jgi:regulator of sigma E protease